MRQDFLVILACLFLNIANGQNEDAFVTAIERAHGSPQILIEKGGTIYSLTCQEDTLLENNALGLKINLPHGMRSAYFAGYFQQALKTAGLSVKRFIFLKIIYFDFNSALIRDDAGAELDKLVELMRYYPACDITIIVHADKRGTRAHNVQLVRQRSGSIKKYLSDAEVSTKNVKVKDSLDEEPYTDCPDPDACDEMLLQFNRRAEFVLNALPMN